MLVSEEEVNQTFTCWKEDLVGITGFYGPVVDELLLANVCDHGWDTEQYLSEVLVAGFEESERMTSEAYRKVFARARLGLPCDAPRDVGDVCLVCRERVLGGAVGPCGYRLHSACIAEGLRVQDLCGCSERHRITIVNFTILTQNTPPSRSTNCCPTTAVETKQEEMSRLAKRFLTTTKFQSSLPLLQSQLNPSPICTALRRKPTAATSNLQVMARSPVSAPSFSSIRLKGMPAVHGVETQMSTTTS